MALHGYVLDASAVLALLNQEPGREQVARALTASVVISTVNLSELVARLADRGMPENVIHAVLDSLAIGVVDFDSRMAYRAGLLRPLTRQLGLSLGDRACLALAQYLGLPALTADRAWATLQLGITIQVIR